MARQVHLRQVAGNHELGVPSHACEEHLQLRRGGVLCLVEDDEGVVERASAHEGQRRNLNGVVFQVGEEFLLRYHVAQGVVEGLQVGVELVAQVARQESQVLAGLDGGARQDDASYLLVFQRTHGHGYGGVGFAGTGRADGEDHVVLVHRAYQPLLVGGASLDEQAVAAVHQHLVAHFGLRASATALHDAHDGVFRQAAELVVVGLHGLQLAVEPHDVLLAADGFQHIAAGDELQFREQYPYKVEQSVVGAPKPRIINLFQRKNLLVVCFYHAAKIRNIFQPPRKRY